jgi:hypothetical protein
MAVVGSHPVIAIIVLFIVFFTVFFLLIYGILRLAENRNSEGDEESSEERRPVKKGIPTYAKVKTCPQCGTPMPGMASFCPECGSPQIAA